MAGLQDLTSMCFTQEAGLKKSGLSVKRKFRFSETCLLSRRRHMEVRSSRLAFSVFVLVVKTFKNSIAERVQPIYLRYIRIPFQINCRASAERVQLGPIYLRYISLALQSFLLSC